jgi:hypothetical protein
LLASHSLRSGGPSSRADGHELGRNDRHPSLAMDRSQTDARPRQAEAAPVKHLMGSVRGNLTSRFRTPILRRAGHAKPRKREEEDGHLRISGNALWLRACASGGTVVIWTLRSPFGCLTMWRVHARFSEWWARRKPPDYRNSGSFCCFKIWIRRLSGPTSLVFQRRVR